MRWAIVVVGLALGACGPSVSVEGEETTAPASSGGDGTSTTQAGASSGADGTTTPTSISITDPTPMPATVGDSSTGAPEFSDEQVLGGWLCEGEAPSFYMEVEGYTSPYEIAGLVCVDGDEGTKDPTSWAPCSPLTVHPTGGGGPTLWIYALFAVMPDTISVLLVYDPATDSFAGMWSGPGIEDFDGAAVTCARVG